MVASPQTIMLDPRYSHSYQCIISLHHILSYMSWSILIVNVHTVLHKYKFHIQFLISDTLPCACLLFKTILTPNRWHKNPALGNSEMFNLCLDSRLGRQQPRHLPDELVQPAKDDGLPGEEDERVGKEGFAHTRLPHALTWLLSDQIPGLSLCHHLRDQPILYRRPLLYISTI